ncbi:MAG: hypothetical protein WC882_03715 [Candidatus Gracilibacteria bacterium]
MSRIFSLFSGCPTMFRMSLVDTNCPTLLRSGMMASLSNFSLHPANSLTQKFLITESGMLATTFWR